MSRNFHIAIGRLWQETNTFAETTTGLREFQQYTWRIGGEVMEDLRNHDNELAGFADVVDGEDVECVPLISASTWCGGPVLPEVVTACTTAVVEQLRTAPKLDAVLLSLHGALSGIEMPDVEGHVLTTIRRVVGTDVPIVITLDHHANVTQAMIDAVDVITAYQQCPHTDMRETGRRGARLLMALLQGHFKPVISYRKILLVTPCECFRTAEPPLKNWFDLARQFETQPQVIDVSLFPVFPWMDAPELGWSVVVVTDNNQALADDISAQLATHVWKHRREFFVKKFEPPEAVRRAATAPKGPVVIADGADATNGGSPGDSTCLLREMLAQQITCPALLTIVDPEAVDLAYSAGIGQPVTFNLGAKRSKRYHEPVRVTARIVQFSDGQFDITGHGAMHINMGRCALLEIGSIKVLVSEYAGPGHDPQVFRHIGVEPAEAQIVVVKATVGHMDAYRDIMQENLPCECPGPSPSYLERLDYRHIPRPMFPFDQDVQWQAS